MSYYHRNDLRCASPSAFESGIFCLLFFRRSIASSLLTKSRSPHAEGMAQPHAEQREKGGVIINTFDKQRKFA